MSYAERLGLPLAYISSVDLDLDPNVLDGAQAVVSEAHDEYRSPAMRAILTRARDRGVNLAFIAANELPQDPVRFLAARPGSDRGQLQEPARGSPVPHRQHLGDRQLAGASRR